MSLAPLQLSNNAYALKWWCICRYVDTKRPLDTLTKNFFRRVVVLHTQAVSNGFYYNREWKNSYK